MKNIKSRFEILIRSKQRKFFLGLLFLGGAPLRAQVLDLNALSQSKYRGQDRLHDNKPCDLQAGPIQKDFQGRFYQDFDIWVEQNQDFTFKPMLRGPNRYRTPDDFLNGNLVRYNIRIEEFLLRIVSPQNDPLKIQAFSLDDVTGISGTPGPRIDCAKVSGEKAEEPK